MRRLAAVLGVGALLVAGVGFGFQAVAQDLVSTSGKGLAYPAFTGSAAAQEDADERRREAAARRHTIRYMRQKLVDLLPEYSALHRARAAVPELPKPQRPTDGGGNLALHPLIEGGVNQDLELSAGVALRFQQPLGEPGRRFEAFTEVAGLAQAEDWLGTSATGTGYRLRAGLRLTVNALTLFADQSLSQGVGRAMEGPSERRARIAYALTF